MELYRWDELAAELTLAPTDANKRRAIDREGSWEYFELLPNGVVVLMTDRHVALQCWAADANDADVKFSEHPTYVEFYNDRAN